MGHITSICCKESLTTKQKRSPTTKTSLGIKFNTQDTQNMEQGKQINTKGMQVATKIQNSHHKNTLSRKITFDDFTYTHVLGRGSFGQVLLSQLKCDSQNSLIKKCVIKRMQIRQVMQSSMFDQLQLERKILYESNCKFITKLYYTFRDSHYFYIAMEWASGGDTFSLIRKKLPNQKIPNPRFSMYKHAGEQALRFILGCLILGMEYLHRKNIIYRDLKPENLLIFQDGYVKLADFGLAKELKENERTLTFVGTPVYYAPEVTLRRPYNRQVDLWALGVYCYEMSNYILPFSPNDVTRKQKVQHVVIQAQKCRLWKNNNLSSQLKDFINSLLKFDPKKRLGVNGWNEIKNHSFFTDFKFDWQALQQGRMLSPLKSIIDNHKITFPPIEDHRPKNMAQIKSNNTNLFQSNE